MGGPPSNVVHLDPRVKKPPSVAATRAGIDDDLQSLELLCAQLLTLKGSLAHAISDYSQACVAAGRPDPQARLSTVLRPVEILEAGMHRLAGAMTAHRAR